MALEHKAFLYDGIDDFLSVTVPYLRAGLEREQAVIAVVPEPRLTALRDALPPGETPIRYFDSTEYYRHPVRTLRDYQTIVQQNTPHGVRALAEPVWDRWDDRQTREWVRYESLINVVFESPSQVHALCPYDVGALPSPILDEARRTHPLLLAPGHSGPSDAYVDPETFGAYCDRGLRFERPRTAEYLAVEGDELQGLRSFVGARADRYGLTRQQARNLVTAANEVTANALQHGTPPVGLWLWQDGTDLVCEIGDNGCWRPVPGPLTGFIPPDTALAPGFGLWAVRLLVDLMEIRTDWDGTFIRLRLHRELPG